MFAGRRVALSSDKELRHADIITVILLTYRLIWSKGLLQGTSPPRET